MSAYIHAAAHDAEDVLSGLASTLKDSAGIIEAVTVLAVAAFLSITLHALI
ncbi:hypothetical protein [Niveispirillum lacus]|uniref:hypothetical protein n=1 Tax=Niveispirillum lacus TaxID=1981099 RepID=UPI0013FDBAE1|nr:hypothetical protein [Niveispirillum lacus]